MKFTIRREKWASYSIQFTSSTEDRQLFAWDNGKKR